MKRALLIALALIALARPAAAQFGDVPQATKLVQASVPHTRVSAGGTANAVLTLRILPGWHINANPAANEDAIPTEISLAPGAGVAAGTIPYPSPKIVKLAFDDHPLLVWDGETVVHLPLAAVAGAAIGTQTLKGTVRFQACNDQICLPPATVPFEVAVEVVAAGSAAAPAPDSSAAAGAQSSSAQPDTSQVAGGAGFATAPPAGASAAGRVRLAGGPLAGVLDRGGWAAFLTLFLIGLALNLTPCVYPMIGITVSVFGARRAAPTVKVIGSALLYVLGMATMYSVLGLVAAFTGGLFGGFLQNPIVQVAIGLLFAVLSLSMFGLYEITLPPWLLTKLGGATATGAAGIFASGLAVGVIAAPCIGPPVVALLAVVGAKGDPWFGFTSFFTLAMGLGFPYLFLATFSNLIQSLPRSGEWMVWVKKVFGVILLAVGVTYALLALSPKLAGWVAPVALVVGGIYLGFIEKSASRRPGFRALKWATGVLALAAGVAMIVLAPPKGLEFEEFSRTGFDAALKSGAPVMLDFSADWCVPCHEMERFTFTDPCVVTEAKGFRAFKVDLTHYDSPESDRWRREYHIAGVPTVVFLAADGTEVRGARVEGFIKAPGFCQRMQMAKAPPAAMGD